MPTLTVGMADAVRENSRKRHIIAIAATLVGDDGVVRYIWVGKLSPDKETEVVQHLASACLECVSSGINSNR